jgi:hypothetical protein
MPLQYVINESGETTAVIIPIGEWEAVVNKHVDLTEFEPQKDKFKLSMSAFKGTLSKETGEALQKQVEQNRYDWDQDLRGVPIQAMLKLIE